MDTSQYFQLTVHYYEEIVQKGLQPVVNTSYANYAENHYRPVVLDFSDLPVFADLQRIVKQTPWMDFWNKRGSDGRSKMDVIQSSPWPYIQYGYMANRTDILLDGLVVGRLEVERMDLHVVEGYSRFSVTIDRQVTSTIIQRVKPALRQDAETYLQKHQSEIQALMLAGRGQEEVMKDLLYRDGFRKTKPKKE